MASSPGKSPSQPLANDPAAVGKQAELTVLDRIGYGGRQMRDDSARASSAGPVVYMTSTEAQNGFGRVLETVARNGTVFITRHSAKQAVVMSVEQYDALTGERTPDLDTLTAEFDELLERMQTPASIDGMVAAFRASPEELGRAAVAAARRSAT
jgi:antitoxin Phd